MKKLYDDGITEGELADARVRIKNSLIYQIDQKEKRAINMAYYEFIGYGYKFINELITGVDKVTVAEANRFIKENFTPDKLYLAVVGKK
jgi:predicted Zn-dependent peptidase